jgi:orotate phosphoribosyltransferase
MSFTNICCDKNDLLEELILFLYEKKGIKIGDFTLSSGIKSKFYLDMRILQSYPKYFRNSIFLFKKYIINYIGIDNFDYICSIPTSGTIFGASLAYELYKPHVYVRKTEKNYGTKKTFEGDLLPNSKVLFIDDVITTGRSLISSINLLKDKSIINDVLVFVDRNQGYGNILRECELKVHKVISIEEIFNILYQNNKIDELEINTLKNEQEKT